MKELYNTIKKLNGNYINEAIVGVGSLFNLNIKYGKYSLFVYCAWRLVKGDAIITGWQESNSCPNGELYKGIKSLENDKIIDINLNKFNDLHIVFESGKELQIFCDITPNLYNYLDENWYIADIEKNIYYAITKNQTIEVEKYS